MRIRLCQDSVRTSEATSGEPDRNVVTCSVKTKSYLFGKSEQTKSDRLQKVDRFCFAHLHAKEKTMRLRGPAGQRSVTVSLVGVQARQIEMIFE